MGAAQGVEWSILRFLAKVSVGGTPYPKLHQVPRLLLVCLRISMAPGGALHASDRVMVLCAVRVGT